LTLFPTFLTMMLTALPELLLFKAFLMLTEREEAGGMSQEPDDMAPAM
jgi:hypothetical protein